SADQLYMIGHLTAAQRDQAIALDEINDKEAAREIIAMGYAKVLDESVRIQRLHFPELTRVEDVERRIGKVAEERVRVSQRMNETNVARLAELNRENDLLQEQLGWVRDIEAERAGGLSNRGILVWLQRRE